MALDPVTAVLDIGGKLIDRLWPDPAQRDAAKLELFKMQQAGELQAMAEATILAKGQLEVNAVEAASPNLFVSGWRPAIGWTCAGALFSQYILRPWVQWIAVLLGHPMPQLPGIDDQLWQLLGAMLGMGGLRTFEKLKRVA